MQSVTSSPARLFKQADISTRGFQTPARLSPLLSCWKVSNFQKFAFEGENALCRNQMRMLWSQYCVCSSAGKLWKGKRDFKMQYFLPAGSQRMLLGFRDQILCKMCKGLRWIWNAGGCSVCGGRGGFWPAGEIFLFVYLFLKDSLNPALMLLCQMHGSVVWELIIATRGLSLL